MKAMRSVALPAVEHKLVRWHGLAAVLTLAISVLFGVTVATKMHDPEFLTRYPWLTWGRLRYNHTQGIFFGWLGNAFLAFAYYATPRLANRPVMSRKLGWALFWLWNAVIVLPGWTLVAAGFSQPLEWAEFPLVIDFFVVVAFVMMCAQFAVPLMRLGPGKLYVSGWYLAGGLIFTTLAYPVGNIVPELLPGAMGAAFSGLWIHDAVGLFVTPLALVIAYYVIPAATGRPIYSHFLSLVGFWLLFFLYPLNGTHHYVYSSVPMSAQMGAVWASVLLGFDVVLVVTNLLLSMRGSTGAVGSDVPLRFVWTGVLFYLVVSLQGSMQAVMPVNRFLHFSDWVIGHSHLAMIGFASFLAAGGLTYAWRNTPGVRYHDRLVAWSYWMLLTGMALMVVDLTAAGLVEAVIWTGPQPWLDSVRAVRELWLFRTLTGAPVLAAVVLLWLGLTRGPRVETESEGEAEREVPATEDGGALARWLGAGQVVASVGGVGFFVFSFVALGVLPALALEQEIGNTAPPVMPPLTRLEKEGRHVYAREGCGYCHTQQVRFVGADEERFGPATEAWETRYEYPQQWGTRRIGPDLAREAGVRSADWQLAHLYDPRAVVRDSVMPAYPWLFDGDAARPKEEGLAVLAYLKVLGAGRRLEQDVPGPAAEANRNLDGPAFFQTAGTAEENRRGRNLFLSNCAGCHGESGKGDGPAAKALWPAPVNLTAEALTGPRIGQALWRGVTGAAMPAWRDLSAADLRALTVYVATLHGPGVEVSGASEAALAGQKVFQENCVSCHGPKGFGDGPAAGSMAPAPADFRARQLDTEEIEKILENGVPGTSMPAWKKLSPSQRSQVGEYLRSVYEGPKAGAAVAEVRR